jgi:hypothetical protein
VASVSSPLKVALSALVASQGTSVTLRLQPKHIWRLTNVVALHAKFTLCMKVKYVLLATTVTEAISNRCLVLLVLTRTQEQIRPVLRVVLMYQQDITTMKWVRPTIK